MSVRELTSQAAHVAEGDEDSLGSGRQPDEWLRKRVRRGKGGHQYGIRSFAE